MLGVNGKCYVIYHILTLQIFGTSKKLHFWQKCEEVFNQLNFANLIELYMQKSHAGVTWHWSRAKGI